MHANMAKVVYSIHFTLFFFTYTTYASVFGGGTSDIQRFSFIQQQKALECSGKCTLALMLPHHLINKRAKLLESYLIQKTATLLRSS